jgi:hypothetical protein
MVINPNTSPLVTDIQTTHRRAWRKRHRRLVTAPYGQLWTPAHLEIQAKWT